MIHLRDYQKELIVQTAKKILKRQRVVMCAPTGSGKTVIFSEIIRRHLERDMFNRVLVLTHRTELFSQSVKAVVRTGIKVKEIKAGMSTDREHSECRCLIAMAETIKRRNLNHFGAFTLIIIDEAHRADFNKIIDNYPNTNIIGATATPLSASKKRPLKNYYNDISISVGIQDLIEKGFLSAPRHFKAHFDDSKLKTRGGEFTSESQFEAMNDKIIYENHVELWKHHAGDKKTIVFNVNKEHTIETTNIFKSKGIEAEHILSGDKFRDEKMERFRKGDIQVLLNCEIATTGFDIPDIECVDINRPTQSLPLWLQMCGRGSRVAPGKTEFIILDFGGNIDRHGMWHTPYDWKEIFFNPKKAGENPAPHKECKNCGALILASLSKCPECGEIQPSQQEQEVEKVKGYLKEVGIFNVEGSHIDDLTINELYHLEKCGRYKSSYVSRVARTRGASCLSEYARLKGYKAGWIKYQLELETGYHNYKVRL